MKENKKVTKVLDNNDLEEFEKSANNIRGVNSTDSFKRLLSAMLADNPEFRPSIEEIRDSDWFRANRTFLASDRRAPVEVGKLIQNRIIYVQETSQVKINASVFERK